MPIVTARPQNLTALSDADPTACRLVASFRAHDLSLSGEFPRLGVEKRRLSYQCPEFNVGGQHGQEYSPTVTSIKSKPLIASRVLLFSSRFL